MMFTGGVRARTLTLVLACGSLVVAGPARADDQDKAAARQLYNEATRYYDLNDYARALTLFRQAYLKYEEPVFLYNIGQCERQLGDKTAAVKSYRSYLRKAPNAPNRASVEELIARLETAIAEEASARKSPPQETLRPDGGGAATPPNLTAPSSTAAPSAAPLGLTARPAAPAKPLYKRAWFWGVVGGAAAIVAAGVAVGVVLGQPHDPSAPTIGVVR